MPIYYNNILDPNQYVTSTTSSLGTIYLGGTKVRNGFLKPGAAMSGSGGTIYEYDGYRTHVFTTTGSNTFTVNSLGSSYNQVEVLIVGGGGSSSPHPSGGGGGGGGVVYIQAYPITSSGNINVFVGTGGPKGTAGVNFEGQNGVTSSFAGIVALGGGGGGTYLASDNQSGLNGGSGGGGSGTACPGSTGCITHGAGIGLQPTASLPAGAIGYGNNGAAASNCITGGCPPPYGSNKLLNDGGGGGGAGSAASGQQSGSGLFYNWTGTNTEFGAGGDSNTFKTGSANTGKGGSTGTGYVAGGAAGGSGVVMIRYRYL